jgi:hypothetical protein
VRRSTTAGNRTRTTEGLPNDLRSLGPSDSSVCSALIIERCEKSVGPVGVITSIEDPDVTQKILEHLGLDQPTDTPIRASPAHKPDLATT